VDQSFKPALPESGATLLEPANGLGQSPTRLRDYPPCHLSPYSRKNCTSTKADLPRSPRQHSDERSPGKEVGDHPGRFGSAGFYWTGTRHLRRAGVGDSVCTDAGRTERGFHAARNGEIVIRSSRFGPSLPAHEGEAALGSQSPGHVGEPGDRVGEEHHPEPVPLGNRIPACGLQVSVRQAACVYSLIRR
jgi:hypothetical protein